MLMRSLLCLKAISKPGVIEHTYLGVGAAVHILDAVPSLQWISDSPRPSGQTLGLFRPRGHRKAWITLERSQGMSA